MDTLTRRERSELMSRIRGKNSTPEMLLRSLIHKMGYRYRLHVKKMPGTPDLVFSSRRAVIFMHGCFWHRHAGCKLARLPKTNVKFWLEKLESNRRRDADNIGRLNELGWRVMVIWECQLTSGNLENLSREIRSFLAGEDGDRIYDEIG